MDGLERMGKDNTRESAFLRVVKILVVAISVYQNLLEPYSMRSKYSPGEALSLVMSMVLNQDRLPAMSLSYLEMRRLFTIEGKNELGSQCKYVASNRIPASIQLAD